MEATITTSGLIQLQEKLDATAQKATDFSPLESTIKAIFMEDATERFRGSPSMEVGGTVYGGAYWQPLSAYSLRFRPTGQILIDSHTLERSLTVEGDGANIFEISGTEILFGSNVPYAAQQNDSRPFLFWHPELLAKVVDAITAWLVKI